MSGNIQPTEAFQPPDPLLKVDFRGYKLPPMQKMFVEFLMNDPQMSPTEAARKAGYKHPAVQGSKLLAEKQIKSLVKKLMQARIDRVRYEQSESGELTLTADRVLREIQLIAFSDTLGVWRKNEWMIVEKPEDIPEELRPCIKKIEATITTRETKEGDKITKAYIKIEMYDKLQALSILLKHFMGQEPDDEGNIGSMEADVFRSIAKQMLSFVHSRQNIVDATSYPSPEPPDGIP